MSSGIDPEHMILRQRSTHKRKTRQSISKKSVVLRHLTTRTQVNPNDEDLRLTETMKDACEGKVIFYNNEHQVVEDADFKNDTIEELRTDVAERYFKSLVRKRREEPSDSRQFIGCRNIRVNNI